MKATSSRRQLIVVVLLGLALVGAAMRQWADKPSLTRDIGTLLLVLWLPIIGNVVAFLIRFVGQRMKSRRSFAPDSAFIAHITVRLTPTSPAAPIAHIAAQNRICTLAIGTQGFTARLDVPLSEWLATPQDRAMPLEFLRPSLALPHFPDAAVFLVLDQGRVVAEGQVTGRA